MEHSIIKTVNSGCITQYMYSVGEITLFGFKIMELPLKEDDLPIWFLNFMGKTGVFVINDENTILISGMENIYKQVFEISPTSIEDTIYNRLIVGDYIVYDPRFDDVYATNSDRFNNLLKVISGYTLELDTCPEEASSADDMANKLNDMRNNMEIQVLSSEFNGDPGTITAGVLKTKKDNINPNHYKFGDMESMPFIDAVTEFGEFQPVETPHVKDAIKYLIRYPRKNGLEDLKKAQWFINHLIEVREKIESSVGNQYGSSSIELNANESKRLIELLNAGLDDFDRKKGAKMPVDNNILNGPNNTIDPSTGGVNYSKEDIFTYHEPFEETSKRYQEIRTLAKMFSDVVDNLVPKSREASLAQTKIEEAVMWANAGIARNVKKED